MERVRAAVQVIAVDTNILVRYLIEDDVAQTDRAEAVLRSGAVLLLKSVLLETEWVLRGLYRFARPAIQDGITRLLGLPGIEIEDRPAVARALEWYRNGLDFADALHLASGVRADSFATFDRALRRKARTLTGSCRWWRPEPSRADRFAMACASGSGRLRRQAPARGRARVGRCQRVLLLDVCADSPPNELGSFEQDRVRNVRVALERHGIRLGLHTLSAVNVAETSPFLREAVDAYLRAYIDLAKALGAGWIVVHAGYHFTSDFERRKRTALERLQRAAAWAERAGVLLLLENMNREPPDAEVRYLGHDVAECRYFFDQLTSPNLGWAYTVNHAHMLPKGILGFTRLFDLGRCGEVRLADNRGNREEHLYPGAGHDRFSGHVRSDREGGVPEALHAGVRLDRRHAARPRRSGRDRGPGVIAMADDGKIRCGWAGSDPLNLAYHDQEWGVPLRDDRRLFEMLVLEGFQAGLSWITILRKRDNFRKSFDQFDPAKIASYGPEKIAALLAEPGIVRNRAKVEGAILSARGYLELMREPRGFSNFLWQFVNGEPIVNRRRAMSEIPTETAEARTMSKALKTRGFKFCGPTICYAFMQATGLVDDHLVDCFRHSDARAG